MVAPQKALEGLTWVDQDPSLTHEIEELLDPLCLVAVVLEKGKNPRVVEGPASRELVEQGWRTFLVKVINPAEVKQRLLIESPNARPLPHAPAEQVDARWMRLSAYEGRPMLPSLSGLGLEYRVLQLYSREKGERPASLEFSVGGAPGEHGTLVREWRFDAERGTDGWFSMNNVELEAKDGSLEVTGTGGDPYFGAKVDGPKAEMTIRFWAESDRPGVGQFFWWTKERPRADGAHRFNFVLEPGREHLYEVTFHAKSELVGVRIDPNHEETKMRIDWIDLHTTAKDDSWAKIDLPFDTRPSAPLTFRIHDDEDRPAFACFEIRDAEGRVYPAQSKRLAPDFFFQPQIYRGDGESIRLPPGEYTILCSRGPETIPETKTVTLGTAPVELEYRVQRWIDPSRTGWWSGDHHIHAAGCLHYESPTEGVQPNDMLRHTMGEDLKVGCCLTWGPCFDFQKRFFTGAVAAQSKYPYLLRYDVEVSGFGSHQSGHLNLLNLSEQIFPGGESKHHWPTLGLNTLRWAKKQGAVCGPAHSSIGLTSFVGRVPGTEGRDGPNGLPHYRIPAYDGIGANEFVVDVTHRVPGPGGKLLPAIDFISAMNTQRTAEWNMWYHVLNCGFRVAVSGETDFPCVSGERVGIGRVYVQVDGKLDFEPWVAGLASGRSYVSDGTVHLMGFAAKRPGTDEIVRMGKDGGELALTESSRIDFSVRAAARRENSPTLDVELVVNGYAVETTELVADGTERELSFSTEISDSSWVALRVFPHAHTNPIYVTVGGRPIRASADSARWCLLGVDQCWKSKQRTYDADEQDDAANAYEHARQVYREILRQAGER